jgi:hypothetical protein
MLFRVVPWTWGRCVFGGGTVDSRSIPVGGFAGDDPTYSASWVINVAGVARDEMEMSGAGWGVVWRVGPGSDLSEVPVYQGMSRSPATRRGQRRISVHKEPPLAGVMRANTTQPGRLNQSQPSTTFRSNTLRSAIGNRGSWRDHQRR